MRLRRSPQRPAKRVALFVVVTSAGLASPLLAQPSDADLAKKLANPVAALISVPFQLNYDEDIGTARAGDRWQLNIQPVVPIELNKDWNLISRTILPVVWQSDIHPTAGRQSGLGDTVQSLFLSPKEPTAGSWIWGVGPVFLLPTGSDDLLTGDKWGAGPTGVLLKQDGPWTYGMLANYIWSFAGSSSRTDIDATFVQPFLTYTTPTAWSFALNTESTYDWKAKQWSVPLNGIVSKVTTVGGQLVNVGGGVRYWADSADSGPHGWGLRLVVTLLFPK
jgi:hypothetical protein